MTHQIKITLIALMVLLGIGCTETIELDLNNGDNLKLVVDAWLDNSDRQQVITLSLSRDYYESELANEAVGAIVSVISDSKTYTFTEQTPGKYFMDEPFDAQVGETLTLDIAYEGQNYTATQTLPRIATLENIDIVFYEEFDEENFDPITNPDRHDEYDMYVTFQETPGKGDYYYFGSFEKSAGPNTNLYLGEYFEDDILDGAFIDSEYATYGYYEPGDTIVTQMFSISEDVFDYLLAVDEQTDFRGFIFDTPPANVPSNISNDGKGYFIVSGVSEFEKVLE